MPETFRSCSWFQKCGFCLYENVSIILILTSGQEQKRYFGGDSDGVPPLSIPNREVKPVIADGTAMQCGRVGSRLLLYEGRSKEKYPERPSFLFSIVCALAAASVLYIIPLSIIFPHIIIHPDR